MFRSIINNFKSLPYPEGDLTGKTIVITGANVGLGFEACRHFARLNAARIILACRDTVKGEKAREEIESSLIKDADTSSKVAPTILEVWPVDIAKFDSVKAFAARASKDLDRVDIFMSNAGIVLTDLKQEAEGWEMHLAVNVIGTSLLNILMLPKLRETGEKFGVLPRLCVTSSLAGFMAFFPERKEKKPLKALNENKSTVALSDRYNTSKLLQMITTKHLAVAARASGKGDVVINCLHPGVCNTELFRRTPFPLNYPMNFGLRFFGRTSEAGSRTLMAAALQSDESEKDPDTTTNAKYMDNCEVAPYPGIMQGDEGENMQVRVWDELMEVLEDIQPGIRKNL